MARIDVWLPVRDGARFLERAVASVARQTFRDWRLILVDDGSRDGTAGIAARLALRDSRIHVVTRPAEGIVAALQAAAAHSDAPWVARMDADDVCHRRRLEWQRDVRADVVAGRARCGGSAGEGMRLYVRWQNGLVTHEEIAGSLFIDSPLVHPTVLMSRAMYERAGGYLETGGPEDYELWLRAWRAGARFSKVPRTVLTWRDRPDRLTRTHPMYSPAAFRRAKLEHLPHHPAVKRRPVTMWGAGPIGRAWIRDLESRGVEVERAIDIDPRKIGRRIRNRIPIVDPEEGLARRHGAILGAVGSRGARDLIRRRLLQAGLAEASDFLFLA